MAQSNQSAQAEKSIAQNKAEKRHTGTVFNTRFAAHKDELERLFMSLYNDHAAFESLIDSMAEAYADRPADLKRLDKSREQVPRTRPGLVQARQHVRHDHVHRPIRRRSQKAR